MIFQNRVEAGELLTDELVGKISKEGIVLGIPRGGVVLAKVMADKLKWPLSVMVTKKIGFPGQEELAMGAIAETGEIVWDERRRRQAGLGKIQEDRLVEEVREKIKGYVKKFRQGKELRVKGKMVILVDDGIATGKTVEAGVEWLREKGVKKIILAVAVCAKDSAEKLKKMVDEFVCLEVTSMFMAVGQFYREFEQVSDEEVVEMLE